MATSMKKADVAARETMIDIQTKESRGFIRAKTDLESRIMRRNFIFLSVLYSTLYAPYWRIFFAHHRHHARQPHRM